MATAASRDGSSFVPRLPAWSLLAQLRSGEGAPSLFSSLLRSGEPGAPPPAAAEVAQASRSHFRRTVTARTSAPGVRQEIWDMINPDYGCSAKPLYDPARLLPCPSVGAQDDLDVHCRAGPVPPQCLLHHGADGKEGYPPGQERLHRHLVRRV